MIKNNVCCWLVGWKAWPGSRRKAADGGMQRSRTAIVFRQLDWGGAVGFLVGKVLRSVDPDIGREKWGDFFLSKGLKRSVS